MSRTLVAVTAVLVALLGATLSACGSVGAGSEQDSSGSTPDTPTPTPAHLDPTLPPEAVIDGIGEAYCDGEPYSQGDADMLGYDLVGCDSAGSGIALNFRVFPSETELRLYLDNQSCEQGVYYAAGPTWTALAVSTADAALLEKGGAVPLTCG